MLEQIVVDRRLQIIDAGIAPAADTSGSDFGEEPFDQIQPGRARGCEMQLEAWVFFNRAVTSGVLWVA